MKSGACVLTLVLLALVPSSFGQMAVDIQLDQQRFIRDERLPVTVRITNRSGRPVKIGQSSDWLSFNLEARDGKVIAASREIRPGGQFELESASSVVKTIDLSEGYDFSQPGSYRLTAVAKFPEVDLAIASSSLTFDIVRGTQIWEEICGLPGTNATAQFIRYSLLHANHLKELRLYVRVADEEEGGQARVFPLGNGVSFSAPERIIDRTSDLHVLFQSGPRSFDYVRVNPRAELIDRRRYELRGGSRPRLKLNDQSVVNVVGGVLMLSSDRSVATPPKLSITNAVPTSKP